MATRKNSRGRKLASSHSSTQSKAGPGVNRKMRARMKALWKSPAYRRKMSAVVRKAWKSEDYRAMQSERSRRTWTGRNHTEATKRKISKSKIGTKLSAETRAKMSAAHKGKPSPALGHRHSEETRARMSAQRKGRKFSVKHRSNLSVALTGRVVPLSVRLKIGKASALRWETASDADYERIAKNGNRGKWTWYNGIHFRSSYEARFAKLLDLRKWAWVYEPRRFRLSTTSYLPDFFVPTMKCYVEIKGWLDPDSKEKIRLFREERPDLPLVVVTEPVLKQFESIVQD
jgi:hypothetical protein